MKKRKTPLVFRITGHIAYTAAVLVIVFVLPVYVVLNQEHIKIGISPVFGGTPFNELVAGITGEVGYITEKEEEENLTPDNEVYIDKNDDYTHTFEIVATGKKTVGSKAAEVWIAGMYEDNKQISLNKLKRGHGFDLVEGKLTAWDDELLPASMSFNTRFRQSFTIVFGMNDASGLVRVLVDGEEVYSRDLYLFGSGVLTKFSVNFKYKE